MLETERLLLRAPLAGDVGELADELADPEVMRFIGNGETGSTLDAVDQLERMQRAWRLDGFGRFMVVRAADGVAIGRVGLLAWDPLLWRPGVRAEIGAGAEIELGWTLRRDAWGQGYATEAALAVRDWALREVRPRRLVSLIHPENLASARVATNIGERCGGEITTYRGMTVRLWTLEDAG